ncbi:MAG: AIR synthase-related protein [Thaumarchaeota archaeon]|nr:AIR synthase-related protein [Nitrososphaerota archaeon]
MDEVKSSGKISSSFLEKIIYPNLGARRPEILVGPSPGLDTCVIKIGTNQVLVACTDPLSLIPVLGAADSAWMSVNLIANDLATSGLTPQYMMVDLSLPPGMSNELLEKYWNALSAECARLGIAIVGGNTGKFEGLDFTIVGAGTAFSTGSKNRCVVSSDAKLGDNLILTKGAAISATGILAKVFPKKVSEKIGKASQERASEYFLQISAMNDALSAASVGVGSSGVSAMHDVAEGGVYSACFEICKAASLGMVIRKEKIYVSPETREICELFNIDPYVTLGEGAMMVSCSPENTQEILRVLTGKGTHADVIGQMVEPNKGIVSIDHNGETVISGSFPDPYWNAYYSATAAKWD